VNAIPCFASTESARTGVDSESNLRITAADNVAVDVFHADFDGRGEIDLARLFFLFPAADGL
jgi:hypothetical protein